MYAKLHKAAEKKGHKLEKIQEGWYPGKLINQCTGKHAGKVEDTQKMFEEMKVAEEAKAQELQTADNDRDQAAASLDVTIWPRFSSSGVPLQSTAGDSAAADSAIR